MYKLELNADDVLELLKILPETIRFMEIRFQLDDMLDEIEFKETFKSFSLDSYENGIAELEDEGCSL